MGYKVAVLTSHPVQYQAPLFKALASREDLNLSVFYRSDFSIQGGLDKGFGIPIRWDRPLLEGYAYQFLDNSLEIIAILKQQKFNALLIHSYATLFSLAGYCGGIVFEIPILLHTESEMLRKRNVWTQWIKTMILKSLFSKTAAFLSIGRQNYQFYESFGIPDSRIFQTPYCVDNDFFLQQGNFWKEKRLETLRELSLPNRQPTIIFSGKLIPRKRPFDLLSAYAAIHREGYRANLILIGDGVLRREIEQYIKDNRLGNARVIGFKNQTEISKFYSVGDIFVLPSVFDTWGLVINEAMLFSMPVITTDRVGAGYDLVEDGQTGYRYIAGNVNALAQYLITLLTEDDLRKKMGENSLQKVLGYNYDNCIEGIMNALVFTAG